MSHQIPYSSFSKLIYGTADRKSGKDLRLEAAIALGYRTIDSACQDLHDECAVGRILTSILSEDSQEVPCNNALSRPRVRREDLIIQTKYAPRSFFGGGTIPPYELTDPIPLQVLKSFQKSLTDLQLSSIDVYFLHRPFIRQEQTFAAWEVMEELVRRGGVRCLGVSQVSLSDLETLFERADIKPAVVQNYCGKQIDFDRDVRKFCKAHGIVYQAYHMTRNDELSAEEWKPGRDKLERGKSMEHFQPLGPVASHIAAALMTAGINGENFCLLDGSRDHAHMDDNIRAIELSKLELK